MFLAKNRLNIHNQLCTALLFRDTFLLDFFIMTLAATHTRNSLVLTLVQLGFSNTHFFFQGHFAIRTRIKYFKLYYTIGNMSQFVHIFSVERFKAILFVFKVDSYSEVPHKCVGINIEQTYTILSIFKVIFICTQVGKIPISIKDLLHIYSEPKSKVFIFDQMMIIYL